MIDQSSVPAPAIPWSRRHRWRRAVTVLSLATVAAVATVVSVPGAASATSGCSVRYTVITNWGSGFQAQVAITPGAAVTSWALTYDVNAQQVVTFATNAVLSQSGVHVTLTNASFNGSVPAGSTVTSTVGFNTNPTGTNVPPSSFALNGHVCAYAPQPYVIASAFRPMVAEGGSTSITVQLSQAPMVNTILNLPNATGGVITATPTSLTFTPVNWNMPQTITISSAEDSDTTDNVFYLPIQQQNYTPPVTYISAVPIITQIDND